MISAFIPDRSWLGGWIGLQGIIIVALYALGILVAIAIAKILQKTILLGEAPPFIMELPDYRFPSPRVVFRRVVEQCWEFIHGAGTLILAVTVIVWAAAYFPRPAHVEADIRAQFAARVAALDREIDLARGPTAEAGPEAAKSLPTLEQQRTALETEIANQVAAAYMEQSILGRMGKLVAPAVRPLGWDWKIGCAVIASFPAREVVIGAMGVLYGLGEEQNEESLSLKAELARQTWPGTQEPVYTIPVALSIVVFYALCAQCAATLVTIRRETGSAWWPVFTFCHMTCLAYVGALITYQVGRWFM
jgi:ferrous iron transport protein B